MMDLCPGGLDSILREVCIVEQISGQNWHNRGFNVKSVKKCSLRPTE